MKNNNYSYPEQLVLDAFAARGTLNTNDIKEMKIWQPASIIFSLRAKGAVIEKKMKKVWAGDRFRSIAHYQLLGDGYE